MKNPTMPRGCLEEPSSPADPFTMPWEKAFEEWFKSLEMKEPTYTEKFHHKSGFMAGVLYEASH
jgi:hypothetical protein